MNILATFEFTKFFLIAPSGGYTCKTPCMPLSFVYSWGGGGGIHPVHCYNLKKIQERII